VSLICVRCGKTIVMSSNPDHLGCCAECGVEGITEEEKKRIENSGVRFRQQAEERR